MARKPPDPDFFVNAREPALGVGIVVKTSGDGTQTFKFASGERVFKDAYVKLYMKPAFVVAPEVKAKLVPPPAKPTAVTAKSRHAKLEAEIRAHPDNADPYLVYADWLQEREDPRGELIVAQHTRARAREQKLLREHAAYFMPVMLDRVLRIPKRGGQPHSTATWRRGFLDEIRLALPPTEKAQYVALEDVIADVLAHPSGGFLRRLVLGQGAGTSYTYVAQLGAIARAKHPALRELVVGDFAPTDMELAQTRAGDLSPMLKATPALETVRVKAGELRCSQPIAHANLLSLSIETVELAARELDALCNGSLPRLETLALASDGLRCTFAQLNRLSLPKLRHLSLRGTLDSSGVIDALLDGSLLAQLETLELERSDLDAAGVGRILRRHGELAHLRTLSIGGDRIPADMQAALQKTLGNARLSATRFAITESDVVARAPDRASLTAARKVAHPEKWMALGYDARRDRVWGEYEGSDHYHVYVEFRGGRRQAGCECPSPKDPCKHAIALMLLAARQYAFPEREVPDSVVRHASNERPTYERDWF